PERAVITGNPSRHEFLSVNRQETRKHLGISDTETVVLSFGGSLGALKLNDAIAEIIPMAQQDGITLMVGTGSRYYEQFLKKAASYDMNPEKIRILQYIDNMPTVLAACDLAITRSGAMTVSELCAMGNRLS
ncbi:MAG: UDP-N-acetylglucosamine--N-acetylmuramyl-(pentapeptide) pyrophosphoryl-undecaprenol N-acetylglucosamine transferase, partial [Clostridia bacterium]|nr:UDP-N-acetylglucosamine--N-acetylmuramyl-(pentapeptide) pyrophosphoryl-undecaprenol N-acetylglucosamine transferase [Clostridia bacterium]